MVQFYKNNMYKKDARNNARRYKKRVSILPSKNCVNNKTTKYKKCSVLPLRLVAPRVSHSRGVSTYDASNPLNDKQRSVLVWLHVYGMVVHRE
jgi:hypothetical protein